MNYRNATRSPFETDNEDNISSCGSVKSTSSSQVQCQELYPMEVYENQMLSSTKPNATGEMDGAGELNQSRINQSTRSIYELINDEHMK